MPPAAYFLPTAAKSMQKAPPKPRFWIPFSPTSRSSVGRCRNVVSSALNTVVSTDSRPLRDRQSGHFLETASLHPPLAALRRFPAPLPLIIQNIEGVFLTISGRRGRRPLRSLKEFSGRSAGRCGHRPLRGLEGAVRSDAAGHADPTLQSSFSRWGPVCLAKT